LQVAPQTVALHPPGLAQRTGGCICAYAVTNVQASVTRTQAATKVKLCALLVVM
jgi:hypothetical protein